MAKSYEISHALFLDPTLVNLNLNTNGKCYGLDSQLLNIDTSLLTPAEKC